MCPVPDCPIQRFAVRGQYLRLAIIVFYFFRARYSPRCTGGNFLKYLNILKPTVSDEYSIYSYIAIQLFTGNLATHMHNSVMTIAKRKNADLH